MCSVLLELSIIPCDIYQQVDFPNTSRISHLQYVGLKVHVIDFYHSLGFLAFQSYHMIIMKTIIIMMH